MNLTEMTARVRQDLQDADQANYRWTDDEIEAAIKRCVWEYSIQSPVEEQTDIPTEEGDPELDISGLSGMISVVSVQFPIGESPPHYQHFEHWGERLYMTDPGDGSDARVRWYKVHSITSQGSTIPQQHEEIIVIGATAYLAQSASASTVDKATISGRYATQNFKLWARERLRRYDNLLRNVSLRIKPTYRTMYTDD